MYGVDIERPLSYLREYVQVLRPLLQKGEVHHQGQIFTTDASLPGSALVPLYIAALGRALSALLVR
jgi:alkanesulfonate monooxygenase SsuD/methylene tetrahydromethanopterin reductase-like flavin-dependent oxidoreductase (luciferase family)